MSLDATGSTDPDGSIVSYDWRFGDGKSGAGRQVKHTYIRPGTITVDLKVTDDQGAVSAASMELVITGLALPPDPGDVAPALDRSVATSLFSATEFLFNGHDPIQTGVTAGAIESRRVSVLRGRVLDRQDQPLPGVVIAVLGHPELGQTLSRADGMFDLAVNGGGLITITYAKQGYIPAQRQVNAPWQDYAWLPDVVLIQRDEAVTRIDLASPLPVQVARGDPVTDQDGARRATLLFPQGTAATMVFPDGSTQPTSALSVRMTEFTVGPNGPQAMPADLPATSGFTYALEFSADEAEAAGAIDVRFSAPLPLYVENFLGFPAGTAVPLGSYDRGRGAWVAHDNGRVIQVLELTDGLASLDVDGDGVADGASALAALGITDAERRQLAALYSPGQTLWRMPIPHFTQPFDGNWGLIPPPDAVSPGKDPLKASVRDRDCNTAGSIIGCQNQTLGEALGLVGTGFALHYQSERTPGRNEAYKIDIPLSGAAIPQSLRLIELEISVAGQLHKQSFPAATNQETSFTWDRKNGYGQVVQGEQPITVRIGYRYPAVYGKPDRFGLDAVEVIRDSKGRADVILWRTWRDRIGAYDSRGIGLGGWTLSPQHVYVPTAQVLNRGDGRRQTARAMGSTISTVAGTGVAGFNGDGGPATEAKFDPQGIAFGPDGSLYIASPLGSRVRRVAPDGIISTVAGDGNPCASGSEPCGDEGPATQAEITGPFSVAVGPDNALFIGELRRVRKVAPDGIITTVAGTGTPGFSGDGGPARHAQLNTPLSLAVAPDGSLYISDYGNFRIRRVGTDGVISTAAGTGVPAFSGDGGPAALAGLADPRGIAVGQDGSLYIADRGAQRVRRVTPDGIIRTIAGTGAFGFTGDGVPATEAAFKDPTGVAVGADDAVYVADQGNFRIRWMRPGGTINTLAGGGLGGATAGDRGPARQATLQALDSGLAVSPDGGVCFSQTLDNVRVRRISPVVDAFLAGGAGGILVPAEDGSEVFQFTVNGRHIRTLDALTGALRSEFSYDGSGRLDAVIDGDGNVTTVERDSSGNATAIVGPFGKRTQLAVNDDGYLSSVASPANEVAQMTYTADGLLTSLTNPRGQTSHYSFDDEGRLISASDPTGATKTLAQSGTKADRTVTMATALGRATTYRVEELDNGDVRLTTTDSAGAQTRALIGADGIQKATLADGTTVTTVLAPDPRWGMQAPLAGSVTVTTPGSVAMATRQQRTVTLAVGSDPLSLRTETNTLTINGRISTSTFDAATRTLTSTSAAGRQDSVQLDDHGRPVREQVGDLTPISLAYDGQGRLVSVTQGSRVSSYAYGSDGFLASITDPLGRRATFVHDPNGRTIEQTLPGGRVVHFSHDLNGNLSSLTPPGRAEHTFSYTPRDEVTTYSPPLVGAEKDQVQLSYNADRQPLRSDKADGQTVAFQYDTAGRISLLGLVSGDQSYSYDAASRLTSVSTPALSMAYTYDGGLPTSSTWSGAIAGSVSRTFDNDIRVSADSVNGTPPIAVLYDADSLPFQVGALSLTRSAETGLITATALGALSDTRSFDPFGGLIGYTASHGGSAVYALDLTRDALGRITRKTETLGGTTHVFDYTYDLARRLTDVRLDGLLTESYVYDASGNRLSSSGPGGTVTASYDAQDRLTQYGSTTFTHTPNGERKTKTVAGQTTTYRYDSLGNLSGVSLPGGAQIDYVLDGGYRRVGKRINGALAQGFLYQDGLRPIAELDGKSNVVSRFVYADGINVPAYMMKAGVTYRIVTDHLGSPRQVIDVSSGEIAQRLDYDEFGNVTNDTSPGFQPFGFAGGLYDPDTKLTRYGFRDYDPETGRWTEKDPGGFSGGPNLYVYADNDPVNLIDPLGDSPRDLIGNMRGSLQSGKAGGVGDISDLMSYDSVANAKPIPSEPLPTEPIGQIASEPIPLPQSRLSPGGGTALARASQFGFLL